MRAASKTKDSYKTQNVGDLSSNSYISVGHYEPIDHSALKTKRDRFVHVGYVYVIRCDFLSFKQYPMVPLQEKKQRKRKRK